MSVHILERDGRPAFAVLPIEEYERLVAALEDARDAAVIEAFHKSLISGEVETIPAEVVNRLLGGENPVKVLRAHRGLTLQQVAEACGVTNSHISQIERGKRSMSAGLLKRMAAALGVDAELLL
ncbi:helix-turn-helix domain-containing protein [Desulfolutivibrio sulfoxidireducens]|uniref:helix-turn-helix domain-containing protein n=1 Tax=Desulfolutivibrio sulfoxidireducens TaxID=2773299 RepID=UPI00159E8AAD|nr:helix-turn-helix transcriptional regulator [Desulfolutivibrio sulfoxidireducens]QLA17528.1 helix-turn-helix domain-containing protein [Desulfolutivibrio sulfoxidireducens]QLA21114.1 helix-turn-helix domain-containing protein [Desulfolutivibrio sulfoxidireducens]